MKWLRILTTFVILAYLKFEQGALNHIFRKFWERTLVLIFRVRECNEPAIIQKDVSGTGTIDNTSRFLVLSSTIAAVLVAL